MRETKKPGVPRTTFSATCCKQHLSALHTFFFTLAFARNNPALLSSTLWQNQAKNEPTSNNPTRATNPVNQATNQNIKSDDNQFPHSILRNETRKIPLFFLLTIPGNQPICRHADIFKTIANTSRPFPFVKSDVFCCCALLFFVFFFFLQSIKSIFV